MACFLIDGRVFAVFISKINSGFHKNLTEEAVKEKKRFGLSWEVLKDELHGNVLSRRSFSIFHAFLKKAVYPNLFPARLKRGP
jgi:hypothetical protein